MTAKAFGRLERHPMIEFANTSLVRRTRRKWWTRRRWNRWALLARQRRTRTGRAMGRGVGDGGVYCIANAVQDPPGERALVNQALSQREILINVQRFARVQRFHAASGLQCVPDIYAAFFHRNHFAFPVFIHPDLEG